MISVLFIYFSVCFLNCLGCLNLSQPPVSVGPKMNMLSVGMYRPPDVFNQCPSTELNFEAERLQNSMSHYERTGARGQFKIVSFSQGWFFPEASCCSNLRKTAINSLLIWALCLHTPYLLPAPLPPDSTFHYQFPGFCLFLHSLFPYWPVLWQ